MKKVLVLVLSVTLLLTMVACGNGASEQNRKNATKEQTDGEQDIAEKEKIGEQDQKSESEEIEHTGKKIDGEITRASVFSEGLAFVNVNGNKEKAYCINKEGYIVFELDFELDGLFGELYSKFVNGFAKVGEGICDKKGKVTMPSDVGATKFSDCALEGGYILAEKITSDYSSSKMELGVLNTDFEWIVQPSEEIYNATGGLGLPRFNHCYYYNDYFFFEKDYRYDTYEVSGVYLNLKTGELQDQIDVVPSSTWQAGGDTPNFFDYGGNVVLNLETYNTIEHVEGTKFINGKAPIRFFNSAYYFTMINEKGEFLFEPVETIQNHLVAYDGETVLIADDILNAKKFACYDTSGNLLGQIDSETIATDKGITCDISDGVIVLRVGGNTRYDCYFFTTDFAPLF